MELNQLPQLNQSTHVIVADLQHFKLFVLKQTHQWQNFECLLSSDSFEIHQKPSEKLSDRAGHCETAWGRQGSGENHNMVEEEEQKGIRELVGQISEALLKYDL